MGTSTADPQINPNQVAVALGVPFTIRSTYGEPTVEVEAPDLADADLASRLAGIAHDPAFVPAEQINAEALRAQVRDSIATLRTSIDTLKTVTDKTNANITPSDTKTVAREARRAMRQVVALSRLFLGELESTDTGTA